MSDLGELLRHSMRSWPTGVSIVTSQFNNHRHGMTVNSFASVALEPPIVLFTLAHATRTYSLVIQSGIAAITMLHEDQASVSDHFAGRVPDDGDRFAGLQTFHLETGAPLLVGGLAFLDCRVRTIQPFEHSTLFLMDVVAAQPANGGNPLVYFNREYHKLL
jgi:flavin reductase (DIM6/NTAB) family NADH-FMN oxidoreductase RutF